jgi:tellurite resistance-related uncharacterized protein
MAAPTPYKATPVFDQDTLPEAIRSAHNTKVGVWGLPHAHEVAARLVSHEPPREVRVTPDNPAQIDPEAVHHVELDGPVRMQVEFFREPPLAAR